MFIYNCCLNVQVHSVFYPVVIINKLLIFLFNPYLLATYMYSNYRLFHDLDHNLICILPKPAFDIEPFEGYSLQVVSLPRQSNKQNVSTSRYGGLM